MVSKHSIPAFCLAGLGVLALSGCELLLFTAFPPAAVDSREMLVGGNTERAVVAQYGPQTRLGVIDFNTHNSRSLDIEGWPGTDLRSDGWPAADGRSLAIVHEVRSDETAELIEGYVRLIDLETGTETRILDGLLDNAEYFFVEAIDDRRLILVAADPAPFRLVWFVYERDTGETWQIPELCSGHLFVNADTAYGLVSLSPDSDRCDPPPYDVLEVDLLTRETRTLAAGIDPQSIDQVYLSGGRIVWQHPDEPFPVPPSKFWLQSYDPKRAVVETIFKVPQSDQDFRWLVSAGPRGVLVRRERPSTLIPRIDYSYELIRLDGSKVTLATFVFEKDDPQFSVPQPSIVGDAVIWRDPASGGWVIQDLATGERTMIESF